MKKNVLISVAGTVLGMLLAVSVTPLRAQEISFMSNRVVSPEIHPDNSVTFRIFAPASEDITVSGGWMEGFGAREPMIKNDTGLWSLTVGPLAPEIYTYSFRVDGITMMDPANTRVMRDGTRHQSMILIPGEASELYDVKNVPHGNLSKVWYDSPTLSLTRRMYVYTPPGYASGSGNYPVFYLLHGGGGDEDAWTTLGRACQIMDNLIAQGKAKPMIVVMTNGNPGDAAAPWEAPPTEGSSLPGVNGMASRMFEKSLVNDVIPYIDEHYRTLTDKGNRAVSGLSMGGLQTLNLSLDYTEYFEYFGVMSNGASSPNNFGQDWFPNLDERMQNLKAKGYKLFWLGIGQEDFLYQSAQDLRAKLEEFDLDYTYRESTGGHTWSNWRIYLSELAPLLFK